MDQDALDQRPFRDEAFADQIMALLHAAESGNVAEITALLERNPDLARAKNERASENPFYRPGVTALHYAAWCGQKEAADLLLSYGAEINLRDDAYTDTPLGWANENHQYEMIDFLISRGAALNMSDAARTGKLELVKAFIALDPAQVELGGEKSWRPLFSAAGWGHRAVVELLLEHGADVNGRSLHGHTAMHAAVGNDHTGIITLLLDRGADINVQTHDGTTPLHRAVWQRKRGMVELLMDNGADSNIAETNGYTAMDLAVAEEGTSLKDWGEAQAADEEIIRKLKG